MTARSQEKPALLAVFFANPDRYPSTYNGLLLLRERFRVHVVCRLDDEPAGVTWPDDVRVERVGDRRSFREKTEASAAERLRELGGFVWAVRRALSEDRPAVAFAYEPHALAALGLAGCRTRIVYQRHEVDEVRPLNPRSMQDWIGAYARRLGRRRADVVVFSEKHRAEMYQREVGDPRPAMVVPNFPLLSAFPPLSDWDAILEARWREKVALYRGSIGAGTGVLQMVRALPHLDAGIALRLCGRATPAFEREVLDVAAEIGVSSRLRYDGFVPFERLNRETVAAAAGLVLYQRTEANNEFNVTATNKLYECAACGLPVVVPSFPSYREFLAGESWVEHADPADPISVAEALGRIFADRARYEERCRAARRAFEERYNFEAVFAPLRERIVALAQGRRVERS